VEGYPQAKKCRPAVESRVLYFGGKELNYKISEQTIFSKKKKKFGISRQISVFWIEVANSVKFVQPNRQ